MNREEKFIALQNVFFNFDPMKIDVKENNIKDEYDSEITCLLETMDQDPIQDIDDLSDCLNLIFEMAFYSFDEDDCDVSEVDFEEVDFDQELLENIFKILKS